MIVLIILILPDVPIQKMLKLFVRVSEHTCNFNRRITTITIIMIIAIVKPQ